jgi:hypothetical protein
MVSAVPGSSGVTPGLLLHSLKDRLTAPAQDAGAEDPARHAKVMAVTPE